MDFYEERCPIIGNMQIMLLLQDISKIMHIYSNMTSRLLKIAGFHKDINTSPISACLADLKIKKLSFSVDVLILTGSSIYN